MHIDMHSCIYMRYGSWLHYMLAALLLALLEGWVDGGMAGWRDRLQEEWMDGRRRGVSISSEQSQAQPEGRRG